MRASREKHRKKFDFVPNKEQIIMGAFRDLGKPIKPKQDNAIARSIADMWGEDITP